MAKIGLFYGTSTGNTQDVSEMVAKEIDSKYPGQVELFNIADVEAKDLLNYKNLIIACPTWYDGQLQDDWDNAIGNLEQLDFAGVKVAIIGLGDQYSYSTNFCDAMGILAEKFGALKAQLIGSTKVDSSYEFDESKGAQDGQWAGLAIDQVNQEELTKDRVTKWTVQILNSFDLQE